MGGSWRDSLVYKALVCQVGEPKFIQIKGQHVTPELGSGYMRICASCWPASTNCLVINRPGEVSFLKYKMCSIFSMTSRLPSAFYMQSHTCTHACTSKQQAALQSQYKIPIQPLQMLTSMALSFSFYLEHHRHRAVSMDPPAVETSNLICKAQY